MLMKLSRRGQAGYTLAELVMVAAVMVILAGAALPAVKYTSRRTKEMELRHHLRSMRDAIDSYKRYSDMGMLPVDLGTIRGFRTRFHLYTVPGQVYYNASRKLILKGVEHA